MPYFLSMAVLYYALPEDLWGKTLGKLFTKTHVVTWDGEKPGFGVILVRSICRFILL
ncbi:MAG: RDD family protein [Bacteroidetes bacterium]|nr:RDD family protein [Bacteroidota bacterium]